MMVAALSVNFIWIILSEIWKLVSTEYKLNALFTNYDSSSGWKVTKCHQDNAKGTGGPWKPEDILKFVRKGADRFCHLKCIILCDALGSTDSEGIPGEGGDDHVAEEDIPGKLAYNFTNISQFLQGLGVAMIVARADMSTGASIKCLISVAACPIILVSQDLP